MTGASGYDPWPGKTAPMSEHMLTGMPVSMLAEHKAHCHACKAFSTVPGAPWCSKAIELATATRTEQKGTADG